MSLFEITICDLKDGRGQYRKYLPYSGWHRHGTELIDRRLKAAREDYEARYGAS